MKTELEIVKDMMSKYNLTAKDLFSFCICAVNFLEYYEEECMGDVMWNCPERYYGVDSNNTRAVAGALNGEKKAEGWTAEEQFTKYMEELQALLHDDIMDEYLDHFLGELERFEKVYRREIFVPILLGCPVEDYDDSRFDDYNYLESIVNGDNLTIHQAHEVRHEEEMKAFREKQAAEEAAEVERRSNDETFSVLLSCCVEISRMKKYFEEYNKKVYPGRELKVAVLNPFEMIVQTGGKSIEDVQKRLLDAVKYSNYIIGRQPEEKLIPIDQSFKVRPKWMDDYKVGYMVTYL